MKDNAYSRLVGLLKLVLPLGALVLLSTVFLITRPQDPEAALPYAEVEIDELLSDPRLTAPVYSGVTRQGDEIIFTADRAYPGAGGGNGARANLPKLRLIGPDRNETQLSALEAHIAADNQSLELRGEVAVVASLGYTLHSDAIQIALDRSQLISPGPVEGTSPQGQIFAQSMTLTRGAAPNSEVVVFNGQVKLLYQPPKP